jgi:hypothetical protein
MENHKKVVILYYFFSLLGIVALRSRLAFKKQLKILYYEEGANKNAKENIS